MVEEKTVGMPLELADALGETMLALRGFNTLLAQVGSEGQQPCAEAWGNVWVLHTLLTERLDSLIEQAAQIGRDEQ